MGDRAIIASGIGKRYTIGHMTERGRGYRSLRETISAGAAGFLRRTAGVLRGRPVIQGGRLEEVDALRDVSFEAGRGENLGIIGRNGAGKSTLLKILSRITEPSSGRLVLEGRVASLLEVGTGFHPELTGRENIFLNGSILGMSRREIRSRFDGIVEFAGVGKFLDTPVKRYSSGMYVRLAFAVAAHLESDILLVDEVLAVGDASFQKRCLDRMSDISRQGRTVLFVSHNMPAIKTFCSRCLLLEEGRLAFDGPVGEVVSRYLTDGGSFPGERRWDPERPGPGDDSIRLLEARVSSGPGAPGGDLPMELPVRISFRLALARPGASAGLTLMLYSADGTLVLSSIGRIPEDLLAGGGGTGAVLECTIPGGLLNEGGYSVSLNIWRDHYQLVDHTDAVLSFRVHDSGGARGDYFGGWSGVIRPDLPWSASEA